MRNTFPLMLINRLATVVVALSITTLNSCSGIAQQPDGGITLNIGSKAPALNIKHWVSNRDGAFNKVTEFESGKVYVVEFWATWCGPCVASMPHLAKTQDELYDKGVQIISVSDEDLGTVNDFLDNDVRGKDNVTYRELTSVYCLTTDPDRSTSRDYMEAAGQSGIPTAFIVGKGGLIEWTGHPMEMDEPLKQIVAGEWDREAFKEEMRLEREREAAMQAAMVKLEGFMVEIDQRLSAGDDNGALKLMNKVIENNEFEAMREQLLMIRAQLALTMKGPEAVHAYDATVAVFKDYPQALNELAWSAVETAESGEKVGKELLASSIKAAKLALEADAKDPSVLDTLAHLYHLQGKLDKAIETQEAAIANAGELKVQLQPYLDNLKAERAAQN